MMKKTAVYFFLGLLGFIVFTNIAVRKYADDAKKADVATGGLQTLEGVRKEGEDRGSGAVGKRMPDDPAEFGMVVVTPMNAPKDQGQWDKFMARAFHDNRVLETPEGRQAIRKMRMNPVQYDETMTRFEKESANVAEMLKKNPTDPVLITRKETLLKMKAVLEVLKQKGVIDPRATDLPQFDEKK